MSHHQDNSAVNQANNLEEEQIQENQAELEQKRQMLARQAMGIVQSEGGLNFNEPSNIKSAPEPTNNKPVQPSFFPHGSVSPFNPRQN